MDLSRSEKYAALHTRGFQPSFFSCELDTSSLLSEAGEPLVTAVSNQMQRLVIREGIATKGTGRFADGLMTIILLGKIFV